MLGAALAFLAVLGFLTLFVLFSSGPDVLVVISLVILGLIGFAVVSSLASRRTRASAGWDRSGSCARARGRSAP